MREADKNVLKMTVFWNIALCNLVEIDRRFRSAYSLHHQDVYIRQQSATLKKTFIFILATMGT
jgi:hypothetical protein